MSDGGHNYDNSLGKIGAHPLDKRAIVPEPPREIEIQAGTIRVPSAILERTRQAPKTSGGHVMPVSLDLASLADPDLPAPERERLSTAPYQITASDRYIFVSSSTMNDPKYPGANLQILRLEYDLTTGTVTKVIRDADESVFKVALSDFPDATLVGQARQATTITPPTDAERRLAGEIAAQAEQLQTLQVKLEQSRNPNWLTDTLVEDETNTSRIKIVRQKQYSVATNKEAEWLTTYGADDCFIVSVYDGQNKRGALTHLDGPTDGEATFDIMVQDIMQGVADIPPIQITLSGGIPNNTNTTNLLKTYKKIKQLKERYGDKITIKIGDVLKLGGEGSSLALNLETGELKKFTVMQRPVTDGGALEHMQTTFAAMDASINGRKPAKRV